MSERYERGRRRQQSMSASNVTRQSVFAEIADIAPDVRTLATEFAYGDIHTRPDLDAGVRELVILGALAALGDTSDQIESHTTSALGAGIDPKAVVECLMQTIPYAGFPRALKALSAARRALEANDALPTSAHRRPTEQGEQLMSPLALSIDSFQAIDLCNRMFTSIDTRDWDTFEHCFTPEVVTDFSGLWGGGPERSASGALRKNWERLFTGFLDTQHLVSNYHVASQEPEKLTLTTTFRATHFGVDPFGSPCWTLHGRYDISLVQRDGRYLIERLDQTPTSGEGNRNIVLLAVQAANQ